MQKQIASWIASVTAVLGLLGSNALGQIVNENGKVGAATIASSTDAQMNEVALRALRRWEFKPGTKDGKPVAVRMFVELTVDKI